MKKVSVIVPMYKAKSYVKHCVDSLMRQGVSEEDMEILLIDDRSPDDTYEYAKELFKENKAVRVIEQEENGGPGKARNRGLEEACGKYICFADVDDMYVDHAIADMMSLAEEKNADVVHANGVFFTVANPLPNDLAELTEDNLAKIIFINKRGDKNDETPYEAGSISERIQGWLTHELHWNVWGKLYRREFLDKNNIRFFNMKIGEDSLFVMKCMLTAESYIQSNQILYIYRTGEPNSVSRGKGNPKIFINSQRALFETEKIFQAEYGSIPYLKENPDQLEKLLGMHIHAIEGPYAATKYKEIGRQALSENPDVTAIFTDYFGDKAKEKMDELFDKYENYPDCLSADIFSSYEVWKAVKDKIGNNRIAYGEF